MWQEEERKREWGLRDVERGKNKIELKNADCGTWNGARDGKGNGGGGSETERGI
jgi:hypothetical protein